MNNGNHGGEDDPGVRRETDPMAPVPAPTPAAGAAPSAAAEPEVTQKLTPEEQMALFEKELREKDWGHQPC
jgi:hypothetical protein